MKKHHASVLLFAIIFAVMPMILAASPISEPTHTPNIGTMAAPKDDIAALRKSIRYPQWAVTAQIEGRFDLLITVGNEGKVTMINYDAANDSPALALLISDITKQLDLYRFSSEYEGQTIRIPFRFVLSK